MKVLIYMSGGFDTHGPSNHLFEALIEDLLKRGVLVELIQSKLDGNSDTIPDSFKNHFNFNSISVIKSNPRKNRFIKRYISLMIYAIRTRKYLRMKAEVDVVFVQSCPTAPFQVSFAKKLTKGKVIYNIQDMFPGSSIAAGVMKNKFMQDFFYMFQKIAYKNADFITVISEDMKNKVIKQGISSDKIGTISNWYDDLSISPIKWEDNLFVKKYNFDSDYFYVQYAGTMGYVFDYEMVLSVAERLQDYEKIKFHMIGNGSQLDAFKRETIKKNINNIEFFPLEPQSMVSHVYNSCSVCLIPLKKGVIGNSVPSKSALLMACKKVIINSVDLDSEYYRMFNDNKIGISVSNDNPTAVAESILHLFDNKKLLNNYENNAYMFGKRMYSRSNNTIKYIDLFYKLSDSIEEEIQENV